MYATLLADARFHDLLLAFDCDLAATARAAGCPCGGRLHSARYRRKPRGRPCGLSPEHDWRLSFCCAVDGCRARNTPPSLRFLGRKVYVTAIVVLIAILRHGATGARMERLAQVVKVDRRTVERWRRWWRERFTATPFWRAAGAAFMPPVDQERLPASLLERFIGDGAERLIALLRFLSPLTEGPPRQGARLRHDARFLTVAAGPQSMHVASHPRWRLGSLLPIENSGQA